MQMLTGHSVATAGNAFLNGLDILTQQSQIRSSLGYCPQHDALIDFLTVKEHLCLFGRIKGVSEKSLSAFVDAVVAEMGLAGSENKLACQLSGGTKRKLSVGIATIGRPPLVFLDEPSTGMDPGARRAMWDVINRLSSPTCLPASTPLTSATNADAVADIESLAQKQCTVILTTHSMEECEALCNRVGIMVGGRLRCLGTVQHLRARFGKGLKLELKLAAGISDAGGTSTSAHHERVKTWITENFQDAVLMERQQRDRYMCFSVAGGAVGSLAKVFSLVESEKARLGIVDYAISQTSLEQIFNRFAAQQEEEIGVAEGMETTQQRQRTTDCERVEESERSAERELEQP